MCPEHWNYMFSVLKQEQAFRLLIDMPKDENIVLVIMTWVCLLRVSFSEEFLFVTILIQ